jgi:DNA replication and repair protein RecF
LYGELIAPFVHANRGYRVVKKKALMILQTLHLRNFRNHTDTSLEASEYVNVLLGQNGEGKTGVLEAISFTCMSRGLYGAADAVAVQHGKESFLLEAQFRSDRRVNVHVRVYYDRATGHKEVLLNGDRPERLADMVGRFPLVALSPEHAAITKGGPAERRRFVDIVLSQTDHRYLETLLEYRRILRHRNKLLFERRLGKPIGDDTLEPWNTSLVETGAEIILKRAAFIHEFRHPLAGAYAQFVGGREEPALAYRGTIPAEIGDSVATIAERFRQELRKREREETRLGMTLVGPHRDEFYFTLNGMDARSFASQGQHKTFLIALKIAERRYLHERTGEAPLLLFDDVFSELDEQRIQRVLGLLEHLGQVFVTTVNDKMFHHGYERQPHYRRYEVRNGTVIPLHAQTVIN